MDRAADHDNCGAPHCADNRGRVIDHDLDGCDDDRDDDYYSPGDDDDDDLPDINDLPDDIGSLDGGADACCAGGNARRADPGPGPAGVLRVLGSRASRWQGLR